MKKKVVINWQSRREKLNHDILCNQLRIEIQALRQNPTHNPHRLLLLPEHADEYRRLFDSAEDALSTKRLIDFHLFDGWPKEYKTYFGNLFHALFVLETKIDIKIQQLKIQFDRALACSRDFLEVPGDERTEAMVINLQQRIEQLSASISELPIPYIEKNNA